MEIQTILMGLITLALLAVWGFFLWKLSRSRKSTGKRNFYLLLFIPLLFPLIGSILSFALFGGIIALISSGLTGLLLGLIVLALVISYFILWGATLHEVGGKGEPVWFILIFLFSPLWLIYQIVQLIK